MGQVFLPPRSGTNKITLEGYDHLTWRYKLIPYIRTDYCVDMSNMFSGENYSLPQTLDLRNFNTANVITMRSMFDYCMSQNILGLNIFLTSNVEDMAYMFDHSRATQLDLSHFDTSKVETMENMFSNSAVVQLDISSFDTSLVENMAGMFENVAAAIDTSNFDTSAVRDMADMFKGTSGTVLDLTNFNTSLVENMGGMFENADYEEIDMSSFDTSSVEDMNRMFMGCTVEDLDISSFDTSNVEDMSYMLSDTNLETLTIPNNMDVSNVTNIEGMFKGMTIDTLDLTDMIFSSAEGQKDLFCGLTADVLDISTWDLGANASVIPFSETIFYPECIFTRAKIREIRFSNSNNFPENYNVNGMFSRGEFGTLDLSSFHFVKPTTGYQSPAGMFYASNIDTLILPDITPNGLHEDSYGQGGMLQYANVNLLDMSGKTLSIPASLVFGGVEATRINTPNIILLEDSSIGSTGGSAKYVDYSSVDTTQSTYTSSEWESISQFVFTDTKIVWLPSTFILDGNHTMKDLVGHVYTDALNYSELGWNLEPDGVIMHYNASHADFEQAILDDDPDDWKFFFCHTSVPLGSTLTMNQFNQEYSEVYIDDEPVEEGYLFDEEGTFTLKVVKQLKDGSYVQNTRTYTQKITVVDHGNSYSIVGTPYDYTWDNSNRYYVQSVSTAVQCRLYPDKYLFVYPLEKIERTVAKYTGIYSCPSNQIIKMSGIPFNLDAFILKGCTTLTDISEMRVVGTFNPSEMFSGCTNLTDVSCMDKWNIVLSYYYYSYEYNYLRTNSGNYTYYRTFYNTRITSAPKISIITGSDSTFLNCTYLTDISKLKYFTVSYIGSNSTLYFYGIFQGCSRLSNVSRLRDIFKRLQLDMNREGYTLKLSLGSFLRGTAITNTNFIPTEGLKVVNINSMFYECTSLTDLSGLAHLIWMGDYNTTSSFYMAFYGIPATNYSALSGWSSNFAELSFSNTKISNLSFLSDWDLSTIYSIDLSYCSNITSISTLSGKLSTDHDINVSLNYSTAISSLVGLEGISLAGYFEGCSALTSLAGLANCTLKRAENTFAYCTSLTDISALSSVTFDVTSIDGMFMGCTSLTNLNGLQNLDISNLSSLNNLFRGCTSLSNLSAIADWNPYQVRQMNYIFYGCSSITSFTAIRNWVTGQLTNIASGFYGCSSLTSLDGIGAFNVGQCQNLNQLFYGCTALANIEAIRYWYVGNCYSMQDMFRGCTNLASIDPLKGWNITRLTNMTYMFYGDTSIADAAILEDWKNIKSMTSVSRTYAFYQVPRPIPSWAVS